MTTRHTSFDELITSYGALIARATGRQWWQEDKIQARPKNPYATLFITQADGYENPIIENIILDDSSEETYEQIPWNTSIIEVQVKFYGSRANNSAKEAAQRFRSSLFLEARFDDVWLISALSGRINIRDLSQIFREDTEPRVEVKFNIVANIVEAQPLADTKIFDIQHQGIEIIHVGINETETQINVTINDDESD